MNALLQFLHAIIPVYLYLLYACTQKYIGQRLGWSDFSGISMRIVATLILILCYRSESVRAKGVNPGNAKGLGGHKGTASIMKCCASGAVVGCAIGLVVCMTQGESIVKPGLAGATEICFLAPIREEIVFRGLSLEKLEGIMHPLSAIIVSSLLFSATHGLSLRTVIFSFGAGVMLGVIKGRSRTIISVIAAHAMANIVPILYGIL